jgi:hypothetical protein
MGRMNTNEHPSDLLTLAQAAKRFPSPRAKGGHVSLPSLSRWCRSGIRGPHGRRVVLASIRCGGARYIPSGAIAEFLAALQDSPAPAPAAPSPSSAEALAKASERVRLIARERFPTAPKKVATAKKN